MNRRRLAVVASVLALGSVLGYRAGSSASAAPDSKPAPEKKQAAEGKQASDNKQDSLDVRIARAQLSLAEATLRKAQDQNRRVGETISGGLLAQFTDAVQVARAQLEAAESASGGDSLAAWIRRAESSVREAENRWKRAAEVNRLSAGTVAAIDVERLRLTVEIAKLQVERGKALADASTEAKLHWQVDVLNDEVARLKSQTGVLLQNRGPTDF
jgi:hypothetical protein